jgi:hypothetical protein
MKPEKQQLLDELCNGSGGHRREETLRAGTVILRRRRWKRAAAQGAGAALAVVLGGMLAERTLMQQPVTTAPAIAQAAPPKVKYLTDEELLAMFPDTPVGLAKVGDSKRLIFLNPADEKRYVARM